MTARALAWALTLLSALALAPGLPPALAAPAPAATLEQILAWLDEGRLREAAAELEVRAAQHGASPAIGYLLGVVRTRQLRLDEGESLLRAAVEARPTRPAWRHALASNLVQQGRCEAALEAIDAALRLVGDPTVQNATTRARWLYDQAMCQLNLGRLDAAQESLSEVLATRPDHLAARTRRAAVHLDLGRPEAAREDADAVLATAPDSVEAMATRGRAAAALDDVDSAEAAFRAVLDRVPGHETAAYGLAKLLQRRLGAHPSTQEAWNRFRQASDRRERIDTLRASLALAPRQLGPRRELAELLIAAGRDEEAIAELRHVLALDPDDERARRLLQAGRADASRDLVSQDADGSP